MSFSELLSPDGNSEHPVSCSGNPCQTKTKHDPTRRGRRAEGRGGGGDFSSAFKVDGRIACFAQLLVLRRASISMALDLLLKGVQSPALAVASASTAVRYEYCTEKAPPPVWVCSYNQRANSLGCCCRARGEVGWGQDAASS